jgi:hypothetical protein
LAVLTVHRRVEKRVAHWEPMKVDGRGKSSVGERVDWKVGRLAVSTAASWAGWTAGP